MEESKKKICPFNSSLCMEGECALFDDEIAQCEFKDLAKYIGECFTDLMQKIEGKDND
ncbi:MAG: hypothetical protein J6M17_10230 [Ruminococcus sp.]|nr:hypothetical protein [Ruminococcus sp.]